MDINHISADSVLDSPTFAKAAVVGTVGLNLGLSFIEVQSWITLISAILGLLLLVVLLIRHTVGIVKDIKGLKEPTVGQFTMKQENEKP